MSKLISDRSTASLWTLRIGVAGCFIGHGAFGVLTKAAWLRYFAVGHIAAAEAWRLMPLVGWMDIAVGISMLVWPCRGVLAWAVCWAAWTALCRPLAGESAWEFIERAGNYGVPLALWCTTGLVAGTFGRAGNDALDKSETTLRRVRWILRGTTSALLLGHGGCVFAEKTASFCCNTALLWPHAAGAAARVGGALDLVLGLAVLFRPSVALLIAVAVWKFATESLFLFTPALGWEVVERFGSFAAPLALAWLLLPRRTPAADAAVAVSA